MNKHILYKSFRKIGLFVRFARKEKNGTNSSGKSYSEMSVLFNSTISMNIHGIRQQNGIIASMAGIQVNLNNNLSMFIVQTSYPEGSMFIMFILIYWS